MTASKAIQKHCTDCIGGSSYDVPLCQVIDCPLWPFRLGCGMGSKTYRERVKGAWERGGEAVEELRGMGLELADLLGKGPLGRSPRENPGSARVGAGGGPA